MKVHRKFLTILIVQIFLQQEAQSSIAFQKDTITADNSITGMHIDIAELEAFVAKEGINPKQAEALTDFYTYRDYQYGWFVEEGLNEQALEMWNLYEQYLNFTKDSGLYKADLHEKIENFSDDAAFYPSSERTDTELQLTKHFFDFITRAYRGQVDPKKLKWHIRRKKINVSDVLQQFVQKDYDNLKDWAPVNDQYFRLKDKLVKLYRIKEKESLSEITGKRKVYKPGDSAAVISKIKERLFLLGDLVVFDSTNVYDDFLFNAVMKFQKRHGLVQDGIVGPAVFRHLNIPIEDKIQRILVNLERMRWLPLESKTKSVIVNIPEFKLHVYEQGESVMSMDVVVGKSANKTVIFSDQIMHIVFSPYWNLPQSIVKNEVLPALGRNESYLDNHNNMEVVGERNGLPLIRQKPGGGNALGKVKFIFPNRYSIYLHDTPAKELFSRNRRAFSHGCIRVSKPAQLAEYLLKDNEEWTEGRIATAMNSRTEKWVPLNEPVPVFITYFTAWVSPTGELNFRSDIYGHDEKVAQHLFESPAF